MQAIARTTLPFPLVTRGKVRDVYAIDEKRLLIVATDRISAFDVVMPEPIPWKGRVLTQITAWWLTQLGAASPHHLITADADEIIARVPELADTQDQWRGRSMLVKRTRPLPIECVIRGYISGSAWAEYRQSGTLAGERMPGGLVESARLPEAIFSPATKAAEGHDENITFGTVRELIGDELADQAASRSMALYTEGGEIAERSGIIIADTKFEFGLDENGELLLIDEVLTPDSSRFWPRDTYRPGGPQPSLDKQPVRDYLETLVAAGKWNKQAPGPNLPDEVIRATTDRYRDVYKRLTGRSIEESA